jgi:hypothetical protein
MKNLFKSGILVLGIMVSISSCSSCSNKNKAESEGKTDSPKTTIDTTQKTIDTANKAGAGALKKDTVKK